MQQDVGRHPDVGGGGGDVDRSAAHQYTGPRGQVAERRSAQTGGVGDRDREVGQGHQ